MEISRTCFQMGVRRSTDSGECGEQSKIGGRRNRVLGDGWHGQAKMGGSSR